VVDDHRGIFQIPTRCDVPGSKGERK